jgi:hypothetical protein
MQKKELAVVIIVCLLLMGAILAILYSGIAFAQGDIRRQDNINTGKPAPYGYCKDILFLDDFDNGLFQWELQGYPSPALDLNRGTPAPSFDNKGDDLYDNYALSRTRFDYAEGLIITFDMFLNDALPLGCWVDGMVRIPRTEGGSGAAVQVSHRVIGEACYGNPPEERGQTYRDFGITNQSGGYEWFTEIGGNADEDLGEWHHYAIVIRPDHYVEFFVDGALRYMSKEPVNQSYQNMPLAIGSRSHPDYGPALIDSIRVYPYSESFDPVHSIKTGDG